MSFSWADYLQLAETLTCAPRVPGPEEAALRTAVSRAYYAAFCSARNFACCHEKLTLTGEAEDHRRVRNFFYNSANPVWRQIGLDLSRLRVQRNKADYDDQLSSQPGKMAEQSVQLARNVLAHLRHCS
jgi:uncharacterized protein (UPF0332 family)